MAAITNLKSVIFDFDGTIADSYNYYLKVIDEMYPHFNIGDQSIDELEKQRSKSIRTIIQENNIPLLQVLIAWRKVVKRFGQDVDQIHLFPGIKDIMEYLQSKNINITIVSINQRKNIEEFLKQYDLFKYISDIHTSNLFLGKNATLNKVLKKRKLTKDEVVYVGDETRDVAVCKKVGIPIIAVTWGFNSRDGLKPFSPEFIVDNSHELYKILEELINK